MQPSSRTAISISNLGKRYHLQTKGKSGNAQYDTLRDVLGNKLKDVASGRVFANRRSEQNDFWALRGIDLEIKQGERLAIVGHNGAGKSTLLKILSRVTKPTEGHVKVYGKIASLLEVGTGFHPELTGRENIFLNGSILGMTRNDIQRHFDEIVEFAGLEKFLDLPLKRYSSGMAARLGFSVAAHLQSEILIVDEVLAVGDIAFQKKCLGKMDDVSKSEGKTIIFVSHNMQVVSKLCPRAILLSAGRLLAQGPTQAILERYNLEISGQSDLRLLRRDPSITLAKEGVRLRFDEARCLGISLDVQSASRFEGCFFEFAVYNDAVERIAHYITPADAPFFDMSPGEARINAKLGPLPLNQGTYKIVIYLADKRGNVLLEADEIKFSLDNAPQPYTSPQALLDVGCSIEIQKKDQAQ